MLLRESQGRENTFIVFVGGKKPTYKWTRRVQTQALQGSAAFRRGTPMPEEETQYSTYRRLCSFPRAAKCVA